MAETKHPDGSENPRLHKALTMIGNIKYIGANTDKETRDKIAQRMAEVTAELFER